MIESLRSRPTAASGSPDSDALQQVSDRLLSRVVNSQPWTRSTPFLSEGHSVPSVAPAQPAPLGHREETDPAPSGSLVAPSEAPPSSTAPTRNLPDGASTVAEPVLSRSVSFKDRTVGSADFPEEAPGQPRLVPWDRFATPVIHPTTPANHLSPSDSGGPGAPDEGSLRPPSHTEPWVPSVTGRSERNLIPLPPELPGEATGSDLPGSVASLWPNDPPRVRARSPEAWSEAWSDVAPERSLPSTSRGHTGPGSIPTDEEIFAAAAAGISPAGGSGSSSGSTGSDLARTNELLQQIIDAIRRQTTSAIASLPGGGNPVFAERS